MASGNHEKRITKNKSRINAAHLCFRKRKLPNDFGARNRHDRAIKVVHHAEAEHEKGYNPRSYPRGISAFQISSSRLESKEARRKPRATKPGMLLVSPRSNLVHSYPR